MLRSDYNPSLVQLALQYGTITKSQYNQLSTLLSGQEISFEKESEILFKQGLATRYQIGLLSLIRDYQIIRKKGEEFGRLAVKKGFATAKDIKTALDVQRKAFRETRLKKLIGDILVESKIITADQKLIILKEQAFLADKTKQILSRENGVNRVTDSDVDLSGYEKEFLKIKALDFDFSAALLEKDLASEEEINRASSLQEEAFEKENTIRLLGDIMVDLNMISMDQREIILQDQGRISSLPETPQVRIEISNDTMSAWAHLPAEGSGGNIHIQDIRRALDAAGIAKGHLNDLIVQAEIEAGLKSILVVKTDYSKALRDAYQTISFLDVDLSDKGEKKKGDVLVSFQGNSDVGPIENVLGTQSDRVSDRDFIIRCGSGARFSRDKDKILATKTGVPALSVERLLFIHPRINVLEDVDLRYGPTETFANLIVSGTVTGAYPIKAGSIKAREIRGGRIEAIGDIDSDVGITDAIIRCQGNVTARYLHNCTLDICGNLYVKNEIFDSEIRCAGKIDSPSCRAVSSYLSAKQGVVLAGLGSERTRPCQVVAGTEDHLTQVIKRLLYQMDGVRETCNRIDEKINENIRESRKIFEKMVELKIFHDRSKKTKKLLEQDFKAKGQAYSKAKIKNIKTLISNFDSRMEKSIQSLKELNGKKKKHDGTSETLQGKKLKLLPKIERQILKLEQTLFAYVEWARNETGIPKFEIKGKVYAGTHFKTPWAEKNVLTDTEGMVLQERKSASNGYEIESC